MTPAYRSIKRAKELLILIMKQKFLKRTISWTAAVSLPALSWVGIMAASPAMAGKLNKFDWCYLDMQDAGISASLASKACAMALEPEELGTCVLRISGSIPVQAGSALKACFRVRRPLELAECVVAIDREVGEAGGLAMDYCRRSLLPMRFSECVVGLARQTPQGVAQVMKTCIEAKSFPQRVVPNITEV